MVNNVILLAVQRPEDRHFHDDRNCRMYVVCIDQLYSRGYVTCHVHADNFRGSNDDVNHVSAQLLSHHEHTTHISRQTIQTPQIDSCKNKLS